MREIKFRMWDAENEQMIDGDSLAFEEYAPISHLLSREGIMQYTTQKDRKGKEVYEGDVMDYFTYVRCQERRKGIVYFDVNQSKYKIVPFDMYKLNAGNGGYTGHAFDSAICGNSEVIGNIYEHPHLLEGEETQV